MKLEKIKARGADGLYRNPVSSIVYYRQYRKGAGETYISTRTKDLEQAKEFRDNHRKKIGGPIRPRHKNTASELFDGFLIRKASLNKSLATLTSIRSSQRFFDRYFPYMLVDQITAEWWEKTFIPETKFMGFKPLFDRENKRWTRTEFLRAKPRKFFNDRKWLKSFLIQCHEDGLITKVPRLFNPDPPREEGKAYTDDEVETLINMAPNPDLRLAILMAVTMGMRRLEIFALQESRVDREKGVIRLRAEDTKTRQARAFAMSPATRVEIVRRANLGRWIFPSKDDPSKPIHKDGYMTAWRNLKKTAGISGRFHWLRHTFLTNAFKAPGANAALICHYAGLGLDVANEVYLHFNEDDTQAVASLVSYENATDSSQILTEMSRKPTGGEREL